MEVIVMHLTRIVTGALCDIRRLVGCLISWVGNPAPAEIHMVSFSTTYGYP